MPFLSRFKENYKKIFRFKRFFNLCNSHLQFWIANFPDLRLRSADFFLAQTEMDEFVPTLSGNISK